VCAKTGEEVFGIAHSLASAGEEERLLLARAKEGISVEPASRRRA
jgi:hypothetical protein